MRLALIFLFLDLAGSFYLPGVAPREYLDGDNVTVKVNSIKSVHAAMPFGYYSLMVCRPEGKISREAENLGEILWGDVIKPSPYQFKMRNDVVCEKLCTTRPTILPPAVSKSLVRLKRRIDDEYRGHLIMDNLPVAEQFVPLGKAKADVSFRVGYPLGTPGTKDRPTQVNNHLDFTVRIHKPTGLAGWRIVGFEVRPYSVDSASIDAECGTNKDFDPATLPPQKLVALPPEKATTQLAWSYSLRWVEDPDVAWVSRWDHYLKSSDGATVHWFGIVTSLLIVLCLGSLVATILLRALHMDLTRYNSPQDGAEVQEETGWKLVHADVFREPRFSGLLSVYVGTGAQLLGMATVTLLFACMGFLSPARRGSLMTAMLLLYALMAILGGLATALLAKMFHAVAWATVFGTGVMFPGQVFVVFIGLDLLLWSKEASNAVSLATLVGLIALWFFVSLPLLFIGGKMGYSAEAPAPPKQVAEIPRQVPDQRWYLHPLLLTVAAGAVSFGAVFIEMYFVLASLWLNKIYYVFGFFALIAVILVVTCAEVAVVLTYFQLCGEDYHWWWRAFFYGGGCGPCLFLYSIYYLTSTLNLVNMTSVCIYFGYMAILSYALFTAMGTVGFLATLLFVRSIYASLKVD